MKTSKVVRNLSIVGTILLFTIGCSNDITGTTKSLAPGDNAQTQVFETARLFSAATPATRLDDLMIDGRPPRRLQGAMWGIRFNGGEAIFDDPESQPNKDVKTVEEFLTWLETTTADHSGVDYDFRLRQNGFIVARFGDTTSTPTLEVVRSIDGHVEIMMVFSVKQGTPLLSSPLLLKRASAEDTLDTLLDVKGRSLLFVHLTEGNSFSIAAIDHDGAGVKATLPIRATDPLSELITQLQETSSAGPFGHVELGTEAQIRMAVVETCRQIMMTVEIEELRGQGDDILGAMSLTPEQ